MVRTKGNVIVDEIKIGDVHYEFQYGSCIRSRVISLPIRDENGYWTWKSKNVDFGNIITYGVNEKYQHYSVNLYNYEAYKVNNYI